MFLGPYVCVYKWIYVALGHHLCSLPDFTDHVKLLRVGIIVTIIML